MERPEFVSDAIELDENGVSFGRYREYVLRPACQPIYSISESGSAQLVAYEGLIRPETSGYPVHPEFFFEQVPLHDKLFIESMCVALHLRSYRKFKPVSKYLFVNVNISNFRSQDVLEREFEFAINKLNELGLSNKHIIFEILEHEVISQRMLDRVCQILRDNSIKFALDDFGTKSSNVERYLSLKPDIVKLDRALFKDLADNQNTTSLLKSMVSAFSESGAIVLMEGVESEKEVRLATQAGVNYLQGFYFGKPELMPGKFAGELQMPVANQSGALKRAG